MEFEQSISYSFLLERFEVSTVESVKCTILVRQGLD